MNIGPEFPDLGMLAAVIAHSQIVIASTAAGSPPLPEYPPLPAGFGEVDIAMLEWIAAEGRRVEYQLTRSSLCPL